MQIGIIGAEQDGRCLGVSRFLESQDAEVIFIDCRSLEAGQAWSFDGQSFVYRGRALDQVSAWYMATYPPALPPLWTDYEEHFLYKDWFVDYMHKREHRTFFLAFLSSLVKRGIPVINPPENMFGQQLKPVELMTARHAGLETPPTLISNDPEAVKAFIQAAQHEVVYKPVSGYGHCKPVTASELKHLERIKTSPVIFQERVTGTAIRATFVDGELVSAARLPSESLDYRDNADYEAGNQVYEPTSLPPAVISACQAYLENMGLLFAGIDLIETADGRHVFLEANSSPMYLELEIKTRHPITFELATALLRHASDPSRYRESRTKGRQLQGFMPYAIPFGENLWT